MGEIFLRRLKKATKADIRRAIRESLEISPKFFGEIISIPCDKPSSELKNIVNTVRAVPGLLDLIEIPADRFREFCLEWNNNEGEHQLTYWDFNLDEGFLHYGWITRTHPNKYADYRPEAFHWVCDTFTANNNARVMLYRYPTAGIKKWAKPRTTEQYEEIRNAFFDLVESLL
jgi:hypothetical protein